MPNFNTAAYVRNAYEWSSREYDVNCALKSEKFVEWQEGFRSRLANLLGVTDLRRRHGDLPLSVRKEGEWIEDSYRYEKLYMASEPEIEIPFYVFVPNKSSMSFPVFIALHGHNTTGKEVFLAEDTVEHDLLLHAIREGFAVIVPDVRAFGEMSRRVDREAGLANSCEDLARKSLLFGHTLIGERVHDVMRLIDYAATRPDLDVSRIVVNGHSGGGAVTLFAAAIDTRVTHAIPTSYFCTFEESILSIRHCSCNIIPGILQLAEMHDIAALCAPRPILFIHGAEDHIFPVSGTQKAFAEVSKVYGQLESKGTCQLHVGDYGHVIHHQPMWSFLREHIALHVRGD